MMRILVAYNPIAGGGTAPQSVESVVGMLQAAGFNCSAVPSERGNARQWLRERLKGSDLLVVMGGDGAVQACAPESAQAGIPLYQLPFGTENLWAKHWGMTKSVPRLIEAIKRWHLETSDLGELTILPDGSTNPEGGRETTPAEQVKGALEPRTFVLMLGGGFDGDVVHLLAKARKRGISHLSYFLPILRTALRWRAPRWDIWVDGQQVIEGERGLPIVANYPEYAGGLNIASTADPSDGKIDLCFLRCRASPGLAVWAIRFWRRRQFASQTMFHRRGAVVELRCQDAVRYQIDGDPLHLSGREPSVGQGVAGTSSAGATLVCPSTLSLQVQKSRLIVLCPELLDVPDR